MGRHYPVWRVLLIPDRGTFKAVQGLRWQRWQPKAPPLGMPPSCPGTQPQPSPWKGGRDYPTWQLRPNNDRRRCQRLWGQPQCPPRSAPTRTSKLGQLHRWATEERANWRLLVPGLPYREQGGVQVAQVSVQRALKDDVPRVLYPARAARCSAVWAEPLLARRPLRTEQAGCCLRTPMYPRPELSHGCAAAALPDLSQVGRHAILIWIKAAGTDDAKVVLQLAGPWPLRCCCYSLQVLLESCPPYRCLLQRRALLRVEVHPRCCHCPLELCCPWELCHGYPLVLVLSRQLQASVEHLLHDAALGGRHYHRPQACRLRQPRDVQRWLASLSKDRGCGGAQREAEQAPQRRAVLPLRC